MEPSDKRKRGHDVYDLPDTELVPFNDEDYDIEYCDMCEEYVATSCFCADINCPLGLFNSRQ